MTIPDHFADSREAVLKARELLRRAHAVIFDFDGLLVDTEYAIYSSWERVFASCGHPLPLDLFNQCLGSGYTHWNPGEHLEKLTGRTFDWETVNSRRQEEIVRDLEHAGLLPGAGELIRNVNVCDFHWLEFASALVLFVDNLCLTYCELISLTAHVFDQDGQMQLTTAGYFETVGRIGLFHT